MIQMYKPTGNEYSNAPNNTCAGCEHRYILSSDAMEYTYACEDYPAMENQVRCIQYVEKVIYS